MNRKWNPTEEMNELVTQIQTKQTLFETDFATGYILGVIATYQKVGIISQDQADIRSNIAYKAGLSHREKIEKEDNAN